jgi:general secretion pathway protein A
MYESFFGLKQAPFSIAPDPRYLYMSERHREALAHLLYGLGGAGGFVLLSGEIGAGKTTVCRCFLEQVPAHCHVAYIFNPKLTVLELLQSVCEEFRIPVQPAAPGTPSVKDYLDPLNRFLLQTHAAGQRCVLVIDEAQNLSAEVLEQLRLLTNLETSERKLLQIILIGQPELRDMVARPELEQLAQRVTARFHLGPLDEDDTSRYLAHRLAVAGRKGVMPFDLAALRRIYQLSGGVPRRINLLADRTLLGAYAQGHSVVGGDMVERAAAEVFDQRRRPDDRPAPASRRRHRRWTPAAMAALALLGVLAIVLGWWSWRGGRTPRPAPAPPVPVASAPLPAPAASAAVPPSALASAVGQADSASASAPASATAPAFAGEPAAASAAGAAASSPGLAAWPPRPAASGTSAGVTLVAFNPATDWAVLHAERDEAWRELAVQWVLALPPGEPCQVAARQQLACYRSDTGTLPLLRQLDRPVVLKLVDGQGRAGRAMLLALNAQSARIAAGPRQWTLPVAQLDKLWRGEFGTLWRVPAGYQKPLGPRASGPAAESLALALAAQVGASAPDPGRGVDALARSRLVAFQRANGLPVDGAAGPTTFMLLNRSLGVVEPRLALE